MKKKIDTKAGIYSIGCTTITIFKYFCLALAIVYLGSFLAAGIIFFLKGNTIEESVIARIYSYLQPAAKPKCRCSANDKPGRCPPPQASNPFRRPKYRRRRQG